MKQSEFETLIINMLKANYTENKGFSLKKVGLTKPVSVVNTVEALIILKIMYGNGFQFCAELNNKFNFLGIKSFLEKSANEYLTDISDSKVIDISLCGIGLFILGDIEMSKKLADFLMENAIIEENNNEYSWDLYLQTSPDTRNADILATYYATWLITKCYPSKKLRCPEWIKNVINQSGDTGIQFSYNNTYDEQRVEALTIALYMITFYYKKIELVNNYDKYIKIINVYFHNNWEAICAGSDEVFIKHNRTQHNIFSFGLAAKLVKHLPEPFYINDGNTIFQSLKIGCVTNPIKNIPFVLELVKLYKVIKDEFDPFITKDLAKAINNNQSTLNSILDNTLKNNLLLIEMNLNKKINDDEIIKIAISTVSFLIIIAIYMGITLFFVYGVLQSIISTISTNGTDPGPKSFIDLLMYIVWVLPLIPMFNKKFIKISTKIISKIYNQLGKQFEVQKGNGEKQN